MESMLTQSQILEDVYFLHRTLSENNPFKFLKERTHHVLWDDLISDFAAWSEAVYTPEDFVRLIMRICGAAKCGHISLASDWLTDLHKNDEVFHQDSPWRVLADNEDTYRKNLYWREVIRQLNNEAPSSEKGPARRRHEVYSIELDKDTMYISIPMMRFPSDEILATYKKVAASLKNHRHLIIDIRGNFGGGDNAWISFLKMIIREDLVTPLYYFRRAGDHTKTFCEYGLKGDGAQGIDQSYFAENGMLDKIDKILLTKEFAPPLMVNELISKDKDSVSFSGKISVIIEKANFSSAEAFLVRVKHNKLATLIGETSGGDGVGCTPAIFILPNSGLCIRYPVLLGLNPDATINDENPVAPDIFCAVAPFDKPLPLYKDNGLAWLKSDEAVQKAMDVFSGTV